MADAAADAMVDATEAAAMVEDVVCSVLFASQSISPRDVDHAMVRHAHLHESGIARPAGRKLFTCCALHSVLRSLLIFRKLGGGWWPLMMSR